MKFSKTFLLACMLACVMAQSGSAEDSAVKASTSSDYRSEELKLSPGNIGGNGRPIETPTLEAKVEGGIFMNSGTGGGVHAAGIIKKNNVLTEWNGTKIGDIQEGHHEYGVNLSPGAKVNMDLNFAEKQFDRFELTGSLGSAYRLRQTSRGGLATGDLNIVNLGATLKDNRKIGTTEAGGTLSLVSASGHVAGTIHRKNAKEEVTFRIPLEAKAGFTLLEGVLGHSNAYGKSTAGSVRPLTGHVGLGVGYGDSLRLSDTLHFNPYTGLAASRANGLDNELALEGLPLDAKLAWHHIRESSERTEAIPGTSLFNDPGLPSKYVITNMITLNIPLEKYLGGNKKTQRDPANDKNVEDSKERKPVAPAPVPAVIDNRAPAQPTGDLAPAPSGPAPETPTKPSRRTEEPAREKPSNDETPSLDQILEDDAAPSSTGTR